MAEKKIFVNKKSILEYLGKNTEDRKLIERMIMRKEVVKVDGGYELVQKDDVRELRKRIEELEDKLTMMEFDLDVAKASVNPVNDEDLKYATAQRHYYEEECENEKKDKQKRIRKCFQWIKQIKPRADWEEFRDRVMSDEE